MKVSLIVLTAGKMRGQAIPVRRFPFVIGRDDECNLRPASIEVSRKHCAILLHDGKAFIRDLDSSNGTRVNGEFLVGETELRDYDRLAIGPLLFHVRLEPGVDKRTPIPPTRGVTAFLGGGEDVDVTQTLRTRPTALVERTIPQAGEGRTGIAS
jgi:pSer/pThr/pTyr-binding forkhead associated (FHA) protein